VGLHQNGGVQYATIEYHNWFGANMSRPYRVIGSCHIEFEREKQSPTTQIQDWKGWYEIAKVQLSKPNPIILIRINMLKEFEELMLDNTLLKVQNQVFGDKNPKWKEWWQIVQKFTEEQIQENMELAHSNEQSY